MKAPYDRMKMAIQAQIDKVPYMNRQVWEPCTENQRKTLLLLMHEGLTDDNRETRLAVVGELLGYPVTSFKDMHRWEAGLLLDVLSEPQQVWELSQDGAYIIQQAELRISSRPQGASLANPQDGGSPADLSDLPKTADFKWF